MVERPSARKAWGARAPGRAGRHVFHRAQGRGGRGGAVGPHHRQLVIAIAQRDAVGDVLAWFLVLRKARRGLLRAERGASARCPLGDRREVLAVGMKRTMFSVASSTLRSWPPGGVRSRSCRRGSSSPSPRSWRRASTTDDHVWMPVFMPNPPAGRADVHGIAGDKTGALRDSDRRRCAADPGQTPRSRMGIPGRQRGGWRPRCRRSVVARHRAEDDAQPPLVAAVDGEDGGSGASGSKKMWRSALPLSCSPHSCGSGK